MSPRAQAPARRRAHRDEQAGLPFSFPAPAAGRHLSTEVATPCSAAFDGDDWLFSVDWEGSRALLVAGVDGRVSLQGATGPLDKRFPALVDAGSFARGRDLVLDGTICVLDAQGRPDLGSLCEAASGAALGGAVYLATDLLRLDGEALTERPLDARLAALSQVIPEESRIQLPDHVVGQGRALATAALERGLCAILARRRSAPYRSGVASPDRLRIALTPRRDTVVVGRLNGAEGNELVLGDWVLGRLALVGTTVASGGWGRTMAALTSGPTLVAGAAVAAAGVSWVRPRLVATVEPGSSQSGPLGPRWRLVALRDDVDPLWCMRRAPVAPPEGSAQPLFKPFSPTVLSGLPLDAA